MSHAAFLGLARDMYRSLLNCIEGLHRQGAIVVEVIESLQYVTSLSLLRTQPEFSLGLKRLLQLSQLCKKN